MPRTSLTLSGLLVIGIVSLSCTDESADNRQPAAAPPPGTDIHLFEVAEDGLTSLGPVSDRAGYDNQPQFTPDNARVLFTSDRSGNMDTFAFELASGEVFAVTTTDEGEYSPTVLPDDATRFSAIRMDLDGVQELWHYPLPHGSGAAAQVAEIDRVGYHTWVGPDRILFFRLGQPSTLQLVTEGAADTLIVARNVGRSLHRIPGQDASSFLVRDDEGNARIERFDWASGETEALAVPLADQEFYAWMPDGTLIQAVDGTVYGYRPGASVDWEAMGETELAGTTRLASSPDGRYLAVVAARSGN